MGSALVKAGRNVVREGRGPGRISLEAGPRARAGAGAFRVRGDEDKGKSRGIQMQKDKGTSEWGACLEGWCGVRWEENVYGCSINGF